MKKNKRPGSGQQRAVAGRPGPAVAALLAQAVGHHQAGRLQEAEQSYRTVLKDAPNNPDALHLSGVLALQMGQPAVAAELIGRAIRHLDGVSDFHDNLGTALAALGRHGDAVQAHRRAVALRPDAAAARYNLGNALRSLQQPGAAAAAFAGALALRPDYAKAWYNLGNARRAEGRAKEAAEALGHAVALVPAMVEAHSNLGDALASLGRLDEALVQYRAVAALRPDDANAHYNLGATLQQMSAYERAELAYRDALRHAPRHPAALNNLGTVLRRLGRPAQAELCHRQALELVPDFEEARYNLGNALRLQGRLDEAAACYEAVLTATPDLATASYNLALIALVQGDLARGWLGYERRFASQEAKPNRRIAAPLWQGELLRGRRLLIWREQGVGDEILFASCYRDMIAWAGGTVTIEADHRLVTLFARSFPGAAVRAESCEARADGTVAERTVPSDFDLQVPAGSLPHRLRDALSGFTPQASWLVADPARVALWRDRLAALGPGLKVGIGWRSQLMTPERKAAYTRLDQWAPLFALPGITFVNLQYDDCAAEIAEAGARFGVRIHRWDDLDLRDDFEGSAALVANLDLVISPAMSAGELAGALGIPVWRFGARDWTQLGAGVRPWFPTMRLWQPRADEALGDVLARMARELARPVGEAARAEGSAGTPDPAPDTLLEQAADHHQHGRWSEAALLYERVLGRHPDHPVALHLSGLLAHQAGNHEGAVALIGRAVGHLPGYGAARVNLGNALLALGRPGAAAPQFRMALALQPAAAATLTNLGNTLDAAHDDAGAALAHRRAATADPGLAVAQDNLGAVLCRLGRPDEAEERHRRALALDHGLLSGWINLSIALRRLGRPALALAALARALALDPASGDAMANRGRLLRDMGQDEAAERWCDRALAVDPGEPTAAFNKGLLRLTRGALAPGWAGYDRRFRTRAHAGAARETRLPPWRGEALDGRRILVWGEQGIGDELMFASCLPDLIDSAGHKAGHVVVECDRRLMPLFARSFPAVTVRAAAGPLAPVPPGLDLQVAAGSLPRWLRPELGGFPARPAFLLADPQRAAVWKDRVEALGGGLKVGIAWRSGLMTADRLANYAPLDRWGPVLAVPGVRFLTLQYGDCLAEIRQAEATFGQPIHRWPDLDLKDDLDGLAALMSCLDLVLTPASSVGELAGALGVPVWRFGVRGDWTTLGTGARPWFPSMRLFHAGPGQTVPDLLPGIARELRRLAGEDARRAAVSQGVTVPEKGGPAGV